MRLTGLLAHFFVVIGSLELLFLGLFEFSVLSFFFGVGSFAVRLIYCLSGVSATVELAMIIIYKPYKSLSKLV